MGLLTTEFVLIVWLRKVDHISLFPKKVRSHFIIGFSSTYFPSKKIKVKFMKSGVTSYHDFLYFPPPLYFPRPRDYFDAPSLTLHFYYLCPAASTFFLYPTASTFFRLPILSRFSLSLPQHPTTYPHITHCFQKRI